MRAMPCVLIVADSSSVPPLERELADPLARGSVELAVGSGGDDTLDLFRACKPEVVVVAATLEHGDASALIATLRELARPAELAVVLVGEPEATLRDADSGNGTPDERVAWPFDEHAVRRAVERCLDRTQSATGQLSTTASAPQAPDRAALRARWAALADTIGDDDEVDPDEPTALLPAAGARDAGATWEGHDSPIREPTVILREEPHPPEPAARAAEPPSTAETTTPAHARVDDDPLLLDIDFARELRLGPDDVTPTPRLAARGTEPAQPIVHVEPAFDTAPVHITEPRYGGAAGRAQVPAVDRTAPPSAPGAPMGFGGADGRAQVPAVDRTAPPSTPGAPMGFGGADGRPQVAAVDRTAPLFGGADGPTRVPAVEPVEGPDFARQLRAKMSLMAQRLFRADQGAGREVDVAPRHDHQTEIDLAAFGEEPVLGPGVTEIEARSRPHDAPPTTGGSWETQVRERGLPDSGDIVRGVSDAALLLAQLYARQTTGRLAFRRADIEKVVYFDQGRPVFAASSEHGDRMGELLVREGKITASQYERCQSIATTSGRRMGEILVDVGYLKRRELLPAVRHHVEDIIFSIFAWDHGHYHVMIDTAASAERIRLSRHAASLILEGIRRKLDRTTLESLIGPSSTVVEVRDRDRLSGIISLGDLAPEERAALAAFDGQADLAHVARTAGVDLADLLPLAWALCVLGLATARRSEVELPDETTALVGETDLTIDRERVHARWQLVAEADYFALLGVRRDATAFEVRRAYQAARRDFAADCFPTDLQRELAHELDDIAHVLDEAFRVLRDDRLRNTYLANLID
jgi:hypothetical protein